MSEMLGIDIGSYAIKLALMDVSHGKREARQLASAYNPVGHFLPNDDGQFHQLATVIKQLLSEQHLAGRVVHAALPESMAYTSVVSMPYLSDAELASSIHWEAEQHIPVPLEEVNLEYEVLYKPQKGNVGEKMQVLLVASRTTVIERLVDLFHTAGIEVAGLETSLLATYRALSPTLPDNQPAMICHLGALSSDVLIVENGRLVLSYTIQTGGLSLTRALEKSLNLSPQQAEEYKRAYGLDPQQLEGRVRQSLEPVMQILIGELRKAVQYFQSSHNMSPIRLITLTGGSAYIPALSTYLAEAFSAEVSIGNPLQGASLNKNLKMPADIASYAVAIGLASQESD